MRPRNLPNTQGEIHEDIPQTRIPGSPDRSDPGPAGCGGGHAGWCQVRAQGGNGQVRREVRRQVRTAEAHEEGQVWRQQVCPEVRSEMWCQVRTEVCPQALIAL